MQKIYKTEEERRKLLTPEQFGVMREKGTEPAFSCPAEDFKIPFEN
jgi:peptide methionine sulfoxide reductase MsrB